MVENRIAIRGLAATLFLLGSSFSWAQCPNNNTLAPGGAITPACPGTTAGPCYLGGQYVLVNVTAGNIYEFNTCGANWDTQLTLYNNTGGASLAYNDDACGLQSQIFWTATFTGQVRVLIDRYNWFWGGCLTSSVCAPLSISCYPPPPTVTNNECGNAIDLFVFDGCFMQTYSNIAATNSSNTPTPSCGWSGTARDIWFRFTTPPSGVVQIRTQAITLNDAAMQLYSGTCGALTAVECDDDDGPGLMPFIDRRCAVLSPNTVYYLRVWGYNGSSGIFQICVDGPDFFPTPPQDCTGGYTLCSSGSVNNASNYTGCTQDLNSSNRGCLLNNERQGTWYFFSPQSTGTIGFNLTPINGLGVPNNVDFDFAIWGPIPTISCPPAGAPLRCSYAYPPSAGTYLTGLAAGNVDTSEPASGNGFVAPITVGAGAVDQVYVMFIDNFDLTGQSFNLNWNLSDPAMLDCTLLPVQVLDLSADATMDGIEVEFTTQYEPGTRAFLIEHSSNAVDFLPIASVPNSEHGSVAEHLHLHKDPVDGLNYYRIRYVGGLSDQDVSKTVSAFYRRGQHVLAASPNPASIGIQVHLPERRPEGSSLRITDTRGRLVASHKVQDDALSMNITLSGMESGCYLMHLVDANGLPMGTGRFVKE